MLRLRHVRGFTLIELLIAISIVGFLLAVAMPSYTTFIQNSKIRSSANSFLTGLQLARTQAVLLNTPVNFILTSTEVTTAATATGAALSGSGPNWVVLVADASLCPMPNLTQCPLIEAKSALEGSLQNVQIAGVTTVTFNGLGQNTTGAATFTFQNSSGGACASTGPMRCLNVVVAPGGQARVCDPATSADLTDTRHC